MNAWDLFEAIGEIAPTAPGKKDPRKRHKSSLRFLILAAVIALFVGSALAIIPTLKVRFDSETVELDGVSLLNSDGNSTNSVTYHTAHIGLEINSIHLSCTEDLSNALTEQWLTAPSRSEFDLLDAEGKRRKFGTLQDTEQFLGIELLDSSRIESLVRGVYVTMVICESESAQSQYISQGNVSPDGLILYISLQRDIDTALDSTLVSECGITVYLPLTQAFVQQKRELTLYSHEKEGPFLESGMLTSSEKSLLLLENAPNQGTSRTAYAVWCTNGIGYLAQLRMHPTDYATALSILYPILSDIK